MKTFSICVPIYQNEANLPVTIPALLDYADTLKDRVDVELLFVNDGSTDRSWEILTQFQKQHPERIKLVNFTRNFGQISAWDASIQFARGDVIGIISADLQDPVELFTEMLDDWEKGQKLVLGVREERADGFISDMVSRTFHNLVNRYANPRHPQGGSDFLLFDRKVAEEVIRVNEKNGHTVMLITWLGWNYSVKHYARRTRELGKSQWTMSKKIKLFIDAFVTNSYLPLRLVSTIGMFTAASSFLYGMYWVLAWAFTDTSADDYVRGWTTIVVLVSFFAGLIMISLGIIGEYLWRIYDESRGRPKFVVDEVRDAHTQD